MHNVVFQLCFIDWLETNTTAKIIYNQLKKKLCLIYPLFICMGTKHCLSFSLLLHKHINYSLVFLKVPSGPSLMHLMTILIKYLVTVAFYTKIDTSGKLPSKEERISRTGALVSSTVIPLGRQRSNVFIRIIFFTVSWGLPIWTEALLSTHPALPNLMFSKSPWVTAEAFQLVSQK